MPTNTTPSTKKKKISVASAKAKGRRLQQWVRDFLRSNLPGVEDDDITSTPGGVNGPDIGLSPLARRAFPWTIECKARARVGLYDALEQAESNLIDNTRPVAIYKQDRKEPIAVLYAKDFLELTTCQKKQTKKWVPLLRFLTIRLGTQNIMLQSFEFVDDSISGTKEYDAMAVLSTQIVDLISQLIDSFVEEVDEDFTKSKFDDGDRSGLPFPELNTVN